MKRLFTILLCLVLVNCGKKEEQASESGTNSTDTVKANQTDTLAIKADEGANEVTRFKDSESYFKLDSYLVNAKLNPTDFQKVDSTCAILVGPTAEQIEIMEKEYGEDLATIADDNMFYQSQAMSLLDSLGIATITASERRYIRLIDNDIQEWTLDLRQKGAPGWNLIFFNVNKRPKVVSAINVNSDVIWEYFGDPEGQGR